MWVPGAEGTTGTERRWSAKLQVATSVQGQFHHVGVESNSYCIKVERNNKDGNDVRGTGFILNPVPFVSPSIQLIFNLLNIMIIINTNKSDNLWEQTGRYLQRGGLVEWEQRTSRSRAASGWKLGRKIKWGNDQGKHRTGRNIDSVWKPW